MWGERCNVQVILAGTQRTFFYHANLEGCLVPDGV